MWECGCSQDFECFNLMVTEINTLYFLVIHNFVVIGETGICLKQLVLPCTANVVALHHVCASAESCCLSDGLYQQYFYRLLQEIVAEIGCSFTKSTKVKIQPVTHMLTEITE